MTSSILAPRTYKGHAWSWHVRHEEIDHSLSLDERPREPDRCEPAEQAIDVGGTLLTPGSLSRGSNTLEPLDGIGLT